MRTFSSLLVACLALGLSACPAKRAGGDPDAAASASKPAAIEAPLEAKRPHAATPASPPEAPAAQAPAEAAATTDEPSAAGRGMPCPTGKCEAGLECIKYYGIAGPRGPEFSSCERRCVKRTCPAGETCAVIADGPGEVCRVKRQ